MSFAPTAFICGLLVRQAQLPLVAIEQTAFPRAQFTNPGFIMYLKGFSGCPLGDCFDGTFRMSAAPVDF
jgi:hypothetical protein